MKHRIFTKVLQEWRRPLGGAFGSGMGASRAFCRPTRDFSSWSLNEGQTAYLVVDEAGAVIAGEHAARQLLGAWVSRTSAGRSRTCRSPIANRTARPDRRGVRQRRSIRLRIRNIGCPDPRRSG
jgi:two-component system CheB/CheR fusion protein